MPSSLAAIIGNLQRQNSVTFEIKNDVLIISSILNIFICNKLNDLTISEFAISVDELSYLNGYDFHISSTIHIVWPKLLVCNIHANMQKCLGNITRRGSIKLTPAMAG